MSIHNILGVQLYTGIPVNGPGSSGILGSY